MKPETWELRQKRLEGGKIVRWRERTLEDGTVERKYEEGEVRTWTPQPVELRAA